MLEQILYQMSMFKSNYQYQKFFFAYFQMNN